jgi:hypothetical protein
MGQGLQSRQAEETARALDGVNKPEDVAQDRFVVRFLLEPHELDVDGVQVFAGLRQELAQQIIHRPLSPVRNTS